MRHLFNLTQLCLVLFLPLAFCTTALAQRFQPIFEDGNGRTAIIAPIGYLGLNTENSSVKVQYFMSRSAAPHPKDATLLKLNRFYWGVNVAGSAANGLSTLFSSGSFTPGTSANLFMGHRSLFFKALDRTGQPVLHGKEQVAVEDWLTWRVGGQVANFTIYDATRPFAAQVFSERYRGYVSQLAYNVLIAGATSIGVSWDVSTVNNIGDLASVKFRQQTVVPDPSGQTTRIFEREVNAYAGTYSTSVQHTYSLDVVRYFTPASEVYSALHLYGRLSDTEENSVYHTGVGFYVFPKNKLAGGVFVESRDLTNAISETTDFSKRIDIGLTVKYVLPSFGTPT